MDELLDAIAALVSLVSPEKVKAIAARVRTTEVSGASADLYSMVGTPMASAVVNKIISAWQSSSVNAEQLALMILSAGHVFNVLSKKQSIELVWTGPTTPYVSPRRTEQVLLQIINAAENILFMTSFVAYDVSSIVEALNVAAGRGVKISMLLELSQDHGGSVTFDAISKMKSLVPKAQLYSWKERTAQYSDGHAHAKVAVADGRICFITSANLTGYAMERNMEAGVLIEDGAVPKLLDEHLRSLVDTRVLSRM